VILQSGSIDVCSVGEFSQRGVNNDIIRLFGADPSDMPAATAVIKEKCECTNQEIEERNGTACLQKMHSCVETTSMLMPPIWEFGFPDGMLFPRLKNMRQGVLAPGTRSGLRILAGTTRDEWANFDARAQMLFNFPHYDEKLVRLLFGFLMVGVEGNIEETKPMFDMIRRHYVENEGVELDKWAPDSEEESKAWYWFNNRVSAAAAWGSEEFIKILKVHYRVSQKS